MLNVPNDRSEAVKVGRQEGAAVTLVVEVGHGAHKALLEVVGVVLRHVEDESERESGEAAEAKFGPKDGKNG